MKNLQKGLIVFSLFVLLLCLNNCSFLSEIICHPCPIAECEPENVALDTLNNKYKEGELVVSFPDSAVIFGPNSDTINEVSIKTFIIDKYNDLQAKPIGRPLTLPPDSLEVTRCICDDNIFLIISNIIIGSETTLAEAANTTEEIRDESGIFSLNYLVELDHENEGIPLGFVSKSDIPETSDFFATEAHEPLIAILDSGIDFTKFDDFSGIYAKTDTDISICSIADDSLGYNFVTPGDPNGDIRDLNGHGTVVSLSYKAKMDRLSSMPTTTGSLWQHQRMLTVKVLDECGYGTIFSTTCGLSYAKLKGAKIINCSWGLYFNDAQLQRAIDQIPNETAIVCSAGNETRIIGGLGATHVHFPSGYGFEFTDASFPGVSTALPILAKPNVYEVLGIDHAMDFQCPTSPPASTFIAGYSNKRRNSFAEPAENVESILVGNPCPDDEINGTSFAAPCLTAGLVHRVHTGATFTKNAAIAVSFDFGANNHCYTLPICY